MSNNVQPLTKRHARAVAKLHRAGIRTGFLSSLGPMFLRQLYAAIPSCPGGFGNVWQEPNGRVLGFIACAESTGKLYKQAMLRRGVLMSLALIRFLVRPSVIRKIWQTLRYPGEVGPELPAAEVLSIVVSPEARGKGVGKALMQAANEEFARRGIARFKVAVWTENAPANAFYRKCGFDLVATREHHGLGMNLYTITTSG